MFAVDQRIGITPIFRFHLLCLVLNTGHLTIHVVNHGLLGLGIRLCRLNPACDHGSDGLADDVGHEGAEVLAEVRAVDQRLGARTGNGRRCAGDQRLAN